jgi:hypothetical protein
MHPLLSEEDVAAYEHDGAVLVRGLFADHVETIAAGIRHNMEHPGPYAAENLKPGEGGRFFDDYCNWTRIPDFQKVVADPAIGEVAADLMRADTVQMFHDHVLVKEPGTAKATPWHQDSPYYFVEGQQTVSFWCPVDPVGEATLRCVAGSHRWPRKPSMPMKAPTCRSPIPTPRAWWFLNGRCNPVTPWRLISAFCMAPAAITAKPVGGPSRFVLSGMMPVMSNDLAGHRRPSRGMACDPVTDCAKTGSRLFSAAGLPLVRSPEMTDPVWECEGA